MPFESNIYPRNAGVTDVRNPGSQANYTWIPRNNKRLSYISRYFLYSVPNLKGHKFILWVFPFPPYPQWKPVPSWKKWDGAKISKGKCVKKKVCCKTSQLHLMPSDIRTSFIRHTWSKLISALASTCSRQTLQM